MVDKQATKNLVASLATLKIDKAFGEAVAIAMLLSTGVAVAYPEMDASWYPETHKNARVLLDFYTSKKSAGVQFPVRDMVVAQWLAEECRAGNITAEIRDSIRAKVLNEDTPPLTLDDIKTAGFVPIYQQVIKQKFFETSGFGVTASPEEHEGLAAKLRAAGNVPVIIQPPKDDEVLLYLPTGIRQLDEVLAGEPIRGSLSLVVAETGDGKTFWLIQFAAEAVRRGYNVGIISTEMGEQAIRERYLALQTGISRTAMKLPQTSDPKALNSPQMQRALADAKKAKQIAEERYKACGLGWYHFAHMPASKGPTTEEIFKWVKKVEETPGPDGTCRPLDVLVIDYADELVGKNNKKKGMSSTENLYQSGGDVFMDLHDFAQGHLDGKKRWVWTGSQSQREGSRDAKGKLNLRRMSQKVSGSLRKSQLCEVILGVAMVTKEDIPEKHQDEIPDHGGVGVAVSKMRNSKKGSVFFLEHALDRGALSVDILPFYQGDY